VALVVAAVAAAAVLGNFWAGLSSTLMLFA